MLDAYFDFQKSPFWGQNGQVFLNLQKFSVVSFRRTLPNNWDFIVLGINNFDYSQKRHQCIYKFYWQRLQPKCRSHWQNWSHWYQSGSGFSWEGIKFLQKKASPGKSYCTILKTNWSLNCTTFCNILFLQIQLNLSILCFFYDSTMPLFKVAKRWWPQNYRN